MSPNARAPVACWACEKPAKKSGIGMGWSDRWYVLYQADWNGYMFSNCIAGVTCSLQCLQVYLNFKKGSRLDVKQAEGAESGGTE